MTGIDRYLRPQDDDEKAALVREALAEAAIARAIESTSDGYRPSASSIGANDIAWSDLDEPLEAVLRQLTEEDVKDFLNRAAGGIEFRGALRKSLERFEMPKPPREYTDEELEL